jgi:hypothetical protein
MQGMMASGSQAPDDRLAAEAYAAADAMLEALAAVERALAAYNDDKSRQVSRRGAPRATILPAKVAEIDALIRSGKRVADAARETGVNASGMRPDDPAPNPRSS